MNGANPFVKPFDGFAANQAQSPMPAPNMKQATQMPNAAPSPFPSSGFEKQGMVSQKPSMPKLFDE
jgi:hypothetical protein